MRFETRRLWERSFADPRAFIDLYFREKYRKERNETIVRDGRVVSALQKLPYPMTYGGVLLPASYISGACTDEEYRRRGLMGELLEQTHRAMQREQAAFSFLIPATPELFAYYAKQGYTPCFRFGWTTETPSPLSSQASTLNTQASIPSDEHLIYLRDRMQERTMCVQHPLSDLRAVVDDMNLAGDTLWEVRRGTLLVGVALCRAEADGVLLRECLSDDDEAREALVAGIAAHYGRTEVDVVDATATVGEYIGMARIIDAEAMLTAYARLHPDFVKVEDNLAMIAVVGEGMVFSKGTAAGIFNAISDAGINIRMIDQGSSEMNIIIGVQEEDYALAINSIYQSVIKTV